MFPRIIGLTCHLLTAFNQGSQTTVPCTWGSALNRLELRCFFSACLFIWSYACSNLVIKRFLIAHTCCFLKMKVCPVGRVKHRELIRIVAKIQVTWNPGFRKRSVNMSLSLFQEFMALTFSWVWNWEKPPGCEVRKLLIPSDELQSSLLLFKGGKIEVDIGVQLLCGEKFCGQASSGPLSSLRGHEINPLPGDENPHCQHSWWLSK